MPFIRRQPYSLLESFLIDTEPSVHNLRGNNLRGLASRLLSQYNSTRGHSLKLFCPDSRVNARASFFSVRIISLWNRLPASLVQVHNLIKFKSMLRTIDLSFALLGKL